MYSAPTLSAGLANSTNSRVPVVCAPMITGIRPDDSCTTASVNATRSSNDIVGEVPGSSTGQQNAVPGPQSAVEKEPDVPLDSRQVELQIAVTKHRGDGEVAPTEAVPQSLSIHVSLLGVVILCR